MDISSVVVATAEDYGLSARYILKDDFTNVKYGEYYGESHGVLVGSEAEIRSLTDGEADWSIYTPSPSVKPWTDDYSSVTGPIRSFIFKEYDVRAVN
jgi:hypothetical protein